MDDPATPLEEMAEAMDTIVRAGSEPLWQDRTYPSLSAVARAITGTSWNGRRFFGLRMKPKADRPEAGQ